MYNEKPQSYLQHHPYEIYYGVLRLVYVEITHLQWLFDSVKPLRIGRWRSLLRFSAQLPIRL